MSVHAVRSRSKTLRRAAPLVACALLGCVGPPPEVAPQRRAAEIGSLEGELPFHETPLPIDDGEPIPSPLSLADAVRRALTRSPQVQVALARARAALAAAEQARRLPNPVVDVAFRFVEGGGQPQIDVGLTAELLALLTRRDRAGAADARLEAAAHDVVAHALEVVATVRVDFADVQALARRDELLAERLRFFERLLTTARAKLDVGEGVRFDVLSLEAQRLELELERETRQAELAVARRRLLRDLGAPGRAHDAELVVAPWSEPAAPPDDEQPWIDAALATRPDLLAKRAELAAAEAEASAAGLGVLEGVSAGVEAERDGDWSVGPSLALPLPLLDGGGPRRAMARARVVEARHALAAAERDAIFEVRAAFAELRGARSRLQRVATELLPIERQRRDQVEAVYLGGESDVTALLLAERDLRQAQEREVELQQATVTVRARLERSAGGASRGEETKR